MLYLFLIASLCIYKAAGQDCTSISDPTECVESGCRLRSTGLCLSEGGPTCCLDVTTTESPETTESAETTEEACPTGLDSCESYTSSTCCPSECVASTSTLCRTEGGPGCCTTATTDSPTTTTTTDAPTTTTTTDEPTLAPTCPTSDVCEDYTDATQYGCCPDYCIVVTTGTCYYEGGPDCCKTETESPTTTTTTTTTQEPTSTTTTQEPTTSTTTASPTTSTTTEEPTTSTTTESPTESTTTEAPTTTTEEAETTEQESEEETTESSSEETTESSSEETTESSSEEKTTDSSSDESWPTPRPTMRSAEKWEMIHPAYKGNDGELLWHVYYGDFSNDGRFDSFRKAEQWDTKEIKPIIMHDPQFKGYRHANSKKFKQESAVITDNNTASGASSYGSWLIGISAVLIVLFAVWYKYGPKDKKSEYTPLLTEEKVQYDQ